MFDILIYYNTIVYIWYIMVSKHDQYVQPSHIWLWVGKSYVDSRPWPETIMVNDTKFFNAVYEYF